MIGTANRLAKSRPSHRFCVAPMMDFTDRHCRFLMRLLSREALLYTEMITATALTRGHSPDRFLDFNDKEHPVAVQVGGSDPTELARATQMANDWGYDEVNLNVGCPSDRVTSGRFGACLMADPHLVADCIAAMRSASQIPVTVKTRIGIDDLDENHHLDLFVDTVAKAGCNTFIIHARKAWLNGLSPKENREIPPLNYERVYNLKNQFPALEIIINGGIQNLETAEAILSPNRGLSLDGVMLGRSVYNAPYMLAEVDNRFFGDKPPSRDRSGIVRDYIEYAKIEMQRGARKHHVLKHLVGLYYGCAGARLWRQTVTRAGQAECRIEDLISLSESLDCSLFVAA